MPKVYLVGAGPGPADLLTVRALRLLERADLVLHDSLVSAEVLALATRAHLVPVGKRCGQISTAQAFINRALVEAARRHAVVVRLKGGDPLIFGRAQEEIDALRAEGIDVEVVPGVTAALAASAELGISLTERGVSRTLSFATPRVGAGEEAGGEDWLPAVAGAHTCALYMASGAAAGVAGALIAAGKPTTLPTVVVERAGSPNCRVFPMTLGELARFDSTILQGPAIVLAGEVYARLLQRARAPQAIVVAG